jgi:hypothetical protein
VSRNELKGMFVPATAYIPLSAANPEGFSAFVAKVETAIKEQKASGQLPAGLAEQYDLQLEALKDDTVADIQILGIGLFDKFGQDCAHFSFHGRGEMVAETVTF